MSTISTDEQDVQCQSIKEALQGIQRKLVQAGADIQDLAEQINILRNKTSNTEEELSEQQKLIAFKERQICEIKVLVKVLEIKARYFAQALGIIS